MAKVEIVAPRNNATEKLEAVTAAWLGLTTAAQTYGWELADGLAEIQRDELWREAGARSMREWQDAVGIPAPTASKLIDVAKFRASLPDQRQDRLGEIGVWDAVEIRRLAKSGGEQQAVELIDSGKAGVALRNAVRDKLRAVEHTDSGDVFKLTLSLPVECRETFEFACNAARAMAGETDPTVSRLVELILAEYITTGALVAEKDRRDMLDGHLRCCLYGTPHATPSCTGWQYEHLDRHHVLPRSHGGHDGPTVRICRWCHEAWQPKWRELASILGFEEIAAA